MSNAKSSQLKDVLDKPLPHNTDAERMLLGIILLDNLVLGEVAARLTARDFFVPSNGKIFAAMCKLHERTGMVEPVSLCDELRATGDIDGVGGAAYIASLFDGCPRFSNVEPYIRLVLDASTARRLINASNAAMTRAIDDEILPDAQITTLRKDLDDIEAGRTISEGYTGGEAVELYLRELGELYASEKPFLGVATGLNALDYTLGGMQREDLILVGARPSMGKTSAAARLVQGVAESRFNDEGQTIVFSLEMSPESFAARLACGIAKVDSQRARNKRLTREEWTRLADAQARIAGWPLTIYGGQDAASVQSQGAILRKIERKHKRINAVFCDHLGFCQYSGRHTDNNNVLLDWITKYQKALAKQFGIPYILLSQLSRANESRANKRPQLSDLRDSGSLEQNADVVIFPHREHYYDKNADETEAEWNIAKQRNGALRTITLNWEPTFAWFENREIGNDF